MRSGLTWLWIVAITTGCGARSEIYAPGARGEDSALGDTTPSADEGAESSADTGDDGVDVDTAPPPPDPPVIVALSASGTATCARNAIGSTWCWGVGALSGLTRDPVPTRVKGLDDAVDFSIGWYGRIALTASNRLVAWGHGYFGELPRTVAAPEPIATDVSTLAVAQGDDFHCVVDSERTVRCWGDNQLNEIGIARTKMYELTPVPIAGVTSVQRLSAGGWHACALIEDRSVMCWGNNSDGATGDVGRTVYEPHRVPGVTNAVGIAAGGAHTCALIADGSVQCWGANKYGQLGDATMTGRATPRAVVGLTGVRAIAAGGVQSCAILTDGSVVCWGGTAGFAPGATTATPLGRTTPTKIAGLAAITSMGVASDYACALTEKGRVLCFGQNDMFQLGTGTTTASPTPVEPKF